MASIIQIRRDIAINWTAADPILAQGELGIEIDTLRFKCGDGTSLWSELDYLIATGQTDTSSLATTGSNTFNGAQVITGSLVVTGSVTATSFTGSYTGSFTGDGSGLTNLPVPSINTSSLATTGSNTFNGAQVITGSLAGNVVAVSVASSTGSIDLNAGNFFTITLDSGSTTHFNVTNVKAGQTANILVNTNTNSTASFSGNVRQVTGSLYIPSVSGSRDVLTLVSWDTSSAYLAHLKRLV